LAVAAQKDGDARRGAIVFHQAALACARCHDHSTAAARGTGPIGPDLAALDRKTSAAEIVSSILAPSGTIRPGFETVVAVLADGRSVAGLLIKKTEKELMLRNPSDGSTVTLRREEVDSQNTSATSLMPADLANQLASRRQFLDLVRYLVEIRDGGQKRADELRPPPSLTGLALPEYESRVDHAGLIAGLNKKSYDRGKAIYERLCINCHGTPEQPGSLPTSLRFAADRFKNGCDPFSMYQTLTRGFGLMTPQTWMVPQQKYDVIHYIREEYLRNNNPSQYIAITETYLAGLPKGDTRGPAPRNMEPWAVMDYGPTLIGTYEIGHGGANIAYKGIAVRLDSGPGGIARGKAWMIFEHDTMRMAGAWTGTGFIDWQGIHFDGRHNAHPHVVGNVVASNPTGPGWANPDTGRFDDDDRVIGRDGRRYGPLPKGWARYRGLYHAGGRAVISYTVGNTSVLESPGVILAQSDVEREQATRAAFGSEATARGAWAGEQPIFTRLLNLGPRDKELTLLIATHRDAEPVIESHDNTIRFVSSDHREVLLAGIQGSQHGCQWTARGNRLCLSIPAGDEPIVLPIWFAGEIQDRPLSSVLATVAAAYQARGLSADLHGGPSRWPQTLTTAVVPGRNNDPFAVDVLTHPQNNPWRAQMRLTGLDFEADGDRMIVAAWDGDLWRVSGLNQLQTAAADGNAAAPRLTWQRIASGLFQPLGVKIVAGAIYVTCRDQLVILRDLNGDGETDFYECFNSDHQVTEHFHEFAMGLQVDERGNFYYAKSARHALPAIVPHHGTLLRIAADGSHTDILATGFRAANGVCLNPDGTFVVTDQEGHWNPKNRINWVHEGGFYGNMFGYHNVTDASDEAMEQPLCWITNEFDRSPGELLWVPQGAWGPLAGSLLNLSYGYGKIFVVPFEDIGGQKQGGMCALPIEPLPTGVMRGRFHPQDRQLYACGMFAWAGSATQPGGLYRIRYTGKPAHLPTGLHAKAGQLSLTFTDPVDREAATNAESFAVKVWDLKRSANYGSPHINERPLNVAAAQLSDDGRTITLKLPHLRPTWGMEIRSRLKTVEGDNFERIIHNSIFQLPN
jgi:putative heme-binding domain-containing protein